MFIPIIDYLLASSEKLFDSVKKIVFIIVNYQKNFIERVLCVTINFFAMSKNLIAQKK